MTTVKCGHCHNPVEPDAAGQKESCGGGRTYHRECRQQMRADLETAVATTKARIDRNEHIADAYDNAIDRRIWICMIPYRQKPPYRVCFPDSNDQPHFPNWEGHEDCGMGRQIFEIVEASDDDTANREQSTT